MSAVTTTPPISDPFLDESDATIREEPLNLERLEQFALELAHRLKVEPIEVDNDSILVRTKQNAAALRDAHRRLLDATSAGEPTSIDMEWLLDNFSVVEEHLREIQEDLPRTYYRELPKTEKGLPRVYEIALAIIAHTDSTLDEAALERFLQSFQQVAALSIGETWAFPIMLRLALVENLRRIAQQILARRKCRASAQQIINEAADGKPVVFELDCLESCAPTIVELLQLFEDDAPNSTSRRNELEQRLRDKGWDLAEILRDAHRRQAANQVTIGNLITSMRLISSLDWMAFFEQVNLAEQTLREDPAEVYPRMDSASRDRYRQQLEQIAKRSRQSDLVTARRAVDAAKRAKSRQPSAVERHVGYYLLGEGRAEFCKSLGYQPTISERIRSAVLRHPSLFYLGGIGLVVLGVLAGLSLALASAGASGLTLIAVNLLAILPASELAISIVNFIVTTTIPPRSLAKLDFKAGIPASRQTLIVAPSMLTSREEVDSLIRRLESHYLSNPDPTLHFALLTDWTDAPRERLPEDAELVSLAVESIRRLNERHGMGGYRPFLLFHRRRQWNGSENCWMGWERKRGKLMELHQWLHGKPTSFETIEGDLLAIGPKEGRPSITYIITLDADTQLPPGAARKLVGAISHPLNRPVFSNGRIASGYALLQPRVGVALGAANRTWYSRIYANSPGIDPYSTATSDVYQDLFGEGSFTGKGIYDLETFEACLTGVFPENQILSHDLIEGCHCRVGLLGDIEVIDGFPSRYDADARRQHRWIRGDWQLLPWLGWRAPNEQGSGPNRLTWLSQWKIFDNLRRSLAPVGLLGLLIASWLVASPLAMGLGLLVIGFPLLLRLYVTIRHRPKHDQATQFRYAWQWEMIRTLLQVVLQLVFLPHRALYSLDAIVRTIYRVYVSRKRLLEWESAAATELRLSKERRQIPPSLWISPALAAILPFLMPLGSLGWAAPALIAWLAAPLAAIWLNQRTDRAPRPLDEASKTSLRRIARRTWFYFEEFVNEDNHWLPPDNVQEYPSRRVAQRISPTNEGLFLVSGLAARDFGFTSLHALVGLWERNLGSWESLEGLHGHPYNWYETVSMRPLRPRYLSTVDSGNLAVCFLTARIGLDDLLARDIFGIAQWTGLVDTLGVARELLETTYGESGKIANLSAAEVARQLELAAAKEAPSSLVEWKKRLQELRGAAEAMRAPLQNLPRRRGMVESDAARMVRVAAKQIDELASEFDQLFGWIECFEPASLAADARWKAAPLRLEGGASPSAAGQALVEKLVAARSPSRLEKLDEETLALRLELRRAWQEGEGQDAAKAWLEELEEAIGRCAGAARDLAHRMEILAKRMESLAMQMDFSVLFNARRRLFSIGFNVDDGRLDHSHYDMLASEARLATYFAIVKGDTDYRSWFSMGRGLTQAAGQVGLVSWGGTMFEYLMPPLFQRMYPGSLLSASCKMALARQQEYGRQCNVPWGISESAFGSMASNQDYHYRSFGAPGIGLKRGLGKDLVISPYSTILALEHDPRGGHANLLRLAKDGGLGPFGFFDAIDYTRDRIPKGTRSVVVRCYMAHHHGMSILAIANLLEGEAIRGRFHRHPLGKAGELLLQERLPDTAPLVDASDSAHDVVETPRVESEVVSRKLIGYESGAPKTHLLTNGEYSVMMTSAGGGYSKTPALMMTRWRRDAIRDQDGQFFYIRDVATGRFWSAGYQPTLVKPNSYEVTFSIDKVEIRRRDGDIETHFEATIAPDHLAELRTIKLTNHSDRPIELEVTSYAEIVLGSQAADLAHPAFQKLFIETEIRKELGAILARRRPRSASEPPAFAFHVLAPSPFATGELEFESSRELFLGRGRGPDAPGAVSGRGRLAGSAGAVLDPIFAIRQRVMIPAHQSAQLTYTTGAASSREEAVGLVEHYRDARHTTRAFEMAWAFQQAELRQMHISPAKAHLYQRWAGPLLYPDADWRAAPEVLAANKLGQPTLWRYGVSGDLPILVARFSKTEHIDSLRELLLAHRFWRWAGLIVDLVLVNDHPGSYIDDVQEQLIGLVGEVHHQPGEPPPNLALVRASQTPKEDLQLLEATASVVLRLGEVEWEALLGSKPPRRKAPLAERGILQPAAGAKKLASGGGAEFRFDYPTPTVRVRGIGGRRPPLPPPSQRNLHFANPWGGFSEDGREYQIAIVGGARPPKPWSNVIANPRFGTLVTESGGGYTWLENSREFKLSAWSNDPTTDPPSEWLYLRDEESGELAYPLPQVAGGQANYLVAHGAGYSRFSTDAAELQLETTIFVAADDPVKLVHVRLHNKGSNPRELSLTYYVEWVLGVNRDVSQLHVQSAVDESLGVLVAKNMFIPEFNEHRAFLGATGAKAEFSGNRHLFLGRQTHPAHPASLLRRSFCAGAELGCDPGGAAHCAFTLAAGEKREIVFLLGGSTDLTEIAALVKKFATTQACEEEYERVRSRRRREYDQLTVRTPSPATDLLMNQWLPNQVLSCRVWGRSAFYQSGGAYGFRDQLQDSMALVYTRPDLAREQLVRAASRQYIEGDVQHWWHPPGGRGTRTRFSDDYLWLALTTCHYLRTTGDRSVLDEIAPFLTSPALTEHEQERYEHPSVSNEQGTLYEHCRRTLARAFRLGPHGLPLMGCGDWNDGMNRVGEGGTGESVWVGWFILVICEQFLPVMRERGDIAEADALEKKANELRAQIETVAWDGNWYKRAFFDDGTPLGSAENDACQIDSIAQSWAVIAGADRERCVEAMNQVWKRLVRRDAGLVLLFEPPFGDTPLDPGYIKGYLPGIRENGGQYTHAALWVAQALALLGDVDRAWEILDLINPVHHGSSAEKVNRYQVEPYVIAADVYGVEPNLGRGGWTWYTGSAAWMYRVILETILGFTLQGNELRMRPRMPRDWPGFEITYQYRSAKYAIEVKRVSTAADSVRMTLDGAPVGGESIPLVDDGKTHQVLIEIAGNR